MFRWFRTRRQPLPDAALAMVDPRATDDVLFTGAQAPALAAASAAVTRLNGRTVVVTRSAIEETAVQKAADAAGGLVEFAAAHGDAPGLALPPGPFQIVVAPDISAWNAEVWPSRLIEIARVLAPGGRFIGAAPRQRVNVDRFIEALGAAGFAAARRLAEANKVEYFEARKPRG